MKEGVPNNLRTIEEIFRDFKGRRAGMIKALTTDVKEFHQKCDPEKETLCLYGYPNEQWEVNLPAEQVPPQIPDPVLGINFVRDIMKENHWLEMVALHCDSWLLEVAFYFGGRARFDEADRESLFDLINDLPTIDEVLTETAKDQKKGKSPVPKQEAKSQSTPIIDEVLTETAKDRKMGKSPVSKQESNKSESNPIIDEVLKETAEDQKRGKLPVSKQESNKSEANPIIDEVLTETAEKQKMGKSPVSKKESNKSESNPKRRSERQRKLSEPMQPKDKDKEGLEDKGGEENAETLCGTCGKRYAAGEFWIWCDFCEEWFHGKCVKVTPALAEHIRRYKCPSCCDKWHDPDRRLRMRR